ncbi:MAG: glycosyltransferase family 9 protein [Pedosphaera sp.]|nr:glycosyltransferase family 9 protein [Pedosphaera sp.]
MKQGKILVIRGGAIGDFILTLPALAALRSTFPDTRLEVLGYPHIASLADAAGVVDAVIPIESRALAGFFARNGSLDPAMSEYFAGCHVIFSYLFDPDEIFRDNLSRVTRAQVIQGPHRPDETSAQHATDQMLRPLERVAVFGADPIPRITTRISPSLSHHDQRLVAVHPGSGSASKNWSAEFWQHLMRNLGDDPRRRVLFIGGEAEGNRLEQLSLELPRERCEVLTGRPLPEVAQRLAGADAFVGHDSGITHLAAAVGLPGVALWRESNATIWRPRSDRFRLVEAGARSETDAIPEILHWLSGEMSWLPP